MPGEGQWRTYQGAWFAITYPPGFKVEPGQKSAASTEGHDSAFFVSPDNTVVFYVFAPQWRTEARAGDVDLNPDREVPVEQNVAQRLPPLALFHRQPSNVVVRPESVNGFGQEVPLFPS